MRKTAGVLLFAAGLATLPACRKAEEKSAAPAEGAPAVELSDAPRAAPLPATHPRVIWIGLDAADWDYLDLLSAKGAMPNWSILSREGYRAKLRSYVPILSPLLWTTQETGVGPDVHRVLDFLEIDPSTGAAVPITEASRRTPSVWNIASKFGRHVGVVGFWATHPAEIVDGFFLSDRLEPLGPLPAASPGVAYPESLFDSVLRVRKRDGNVPVSDLARYLPWPEAKISEELARDESLNNPLGALRRCIQATRVTQRMSRDLYDRLRPELMAVYFETTDEIGHMFAPFVAPKLACTDAQQFEAFQGVPEIFFAMIDKILGQWMRRAKEDGAVLVITSDHGFKWGADRPCTRSSNEAATAPYWHEPTGVFLAWGKDVAAVAARDEVSSFDVAPTLLALLDLPGDAIMPGKAAPVRRRLSLVKRKNLFSETPVRTLGAIPLDPKEASEYTKKLTALGYLAPGSAQASAPGSPRPAGQNSTLSKAGWNNLGIYLRYSGNDAAGARRAWEEALKLDPAYHSPLMNIATLEKDQGRFRSAGQWLLRAISAGQPEPVSTVERWAGEFRAHDPGASVELLKNARSAFPEVEAYTRDLALLLAGTGKCGEASGLVGALESSGKVDDLNAAAVVEACLDQPAKVRELLEHSLALDPNQPRVREALAAVPH